MAIRFEWYENPVTTDQAEEESKKHYHARPTLNGRADTDYIAAQIQRRCSLTDIDVAAVLDALSSVMAEELQEGKRVHLDGLGYFHITLSVDGQIEAHTKRRNTKVRMKAVKFRADQKLKNNIGAIKVEHIKYGAHSCRLTEEAITLRLGKYFETHRVMTRRDFQACCGMTRNTAARHIQQLCQAGALTNIGTKMHPIYVPDEGNSGASETKIEQIANPENQ